jgi:hypothetical protein
VTHGREDVETQLGYVLSDRAWQMIVTEGSAEDLELGLVTVEVVADLVREFWRPPGNRILPSEDGPQLIPGAEQLRARSQAIGAWEARAASQDPRVEAFRRDHLAEGLLAEDAIGAWIAHQDSRDRPANWPVTSGLRADENATYRATADAQLAGVPWVSLTWMERRGASWLGGRWPVPPESVLASLAELATELHDKWRWREHEAVVFVLTGTRPDVRPIDGSSNVRHNLHTAIGPYDITSRITIEVDPVVSPEQLAAWWRGVRRQLFDRRYRPMSIKHLELAQFCAGRPEATTLEQDHLEWNRTINETQPSWRYEDRRNFRRDALVAVQRLLFAGIRPPN